MIVGRQPTENLEKVMKTTFLFTHEIIASSRNKWWNDNYDGPALIDYCALTTTHLMCSQHVNKKT